MNGFEIYKLLQVALGGYCVKKENLISSILNNFYMHVQHSITDITFVFPKILHTQVGFLSMNNEDTILYFIICGNEHILTVPLKQITIFGHTVVILYKRCNEGCIITHATKEA
jgi:hypothetical protein